MPEPGSQFTDWQGNRRAGLVVDDDFSWSEPPAPRRRTSAASAPGRALTGTIVIERGERSERADVRAPGSDRYDDRGAYDEWQEPAPARHYSNAEIYEYEYPQRVNEEGYAAPVDTDDVYYGSAKTYEDELSGRRTVVITGRGSERYPVPRPRRDSDVAFYERGSFRPDSVAMWAVLLGIALLLGSIAH